MHITKLYKREDARRMARTMLTRSDNQEYAAISTRRMNRLPANTIASFAAMPSWMRHVRLARVSDTVVVFKVGGAF